MKKKRAKREAARAEKCRRNFYFFVQEFWDIVIHEDPVWNWHIPYICEELQTMAERVFERKQKEYDLIINVPPGSTKSTICSQMFPAWCWTRDPTIRIISGSYAYDIALEQAVYARDIILSDRYSSYFPYIEIQMDKAMKSNYKNFQNGQRFSTSTGGAVTGIHAHIIVVDDPLNPKEAASEVELENANRWIDQTLSTRKVDKEMTPMIFIMQRLHENDCTGHLLEKNKDGIKHICLPAEISDDVSPPELKKKYKDGLLDPARLSQAVCDQALIDLGSYGHSGQFQQSPAPEEGGMIKKAWFNYITAEEFFKQVKADRIQPVWNFTIDTAYTEKESNDPSGIMAYCYFRNNLYVRHCETVRKLQPDLEKFIEEYALTHGYTSRSRIIIEPKANGLSTAQGMRRRSKLNIVIGKSPSNDKVSRTMDSAPFVEAGRVYMIGGKNEQWIKLMINEIAQFPNATHDERVDIFNMAIDRYGEDAGAMINQLGGGAVG